MYKHRRTGETYTTHSEIRRAFPDADLPSVIDDEALSRLGIVPQRTAKEARKLRKQQIKREAEERIKDTDWRVERARERARLGAEGETEPEVMADREAIRRASNRAEDELDELDDAEEIEAFKWRVTNDDRPPVRAVPRVDFLRRFTREERNAVRQARNDSEDLADFWEMLQLSGGEISLDDPDIEDGLALLEDEGLIDEGRAKEILED